VSRLSDVPIHTRLKLSLLWVSTVFCYIYCDYFELYIPGKLQGMLQGRMVPLGTVTQGTLVGTSLLLAIPSLMIFLSVVLRPAISRSLNLVFGVLYTLMMAMLAVQADWYFYQGFALIEALLTALVVWYAWTWPKAATAIEPVASDAAS